MLFTDVLYICSLSALPKQIIHKLCCESPLATQVEKKFSDNLEHVKQLCKSF